MNLKPQKLGYIEGWLSTLVNIVLFGLKYWVGVKIDSVAMKADAWHTLSDTLTSVIVIVGFWFSNKQPDEKVFSLKAPSISNKIKQFAKKREGTLLKNVNPLIIQHNSKGLMYSINDNAMD